METFAIAVDLGGTNIRVAVIDKRGKIHRRIKRPTLAQEGIKSVCDNLLSAIEEMYCFFPNKQVKGVGLGIAGAINMEKGLITQSPNFPGCEGYPIKDKIQTGFLKQVAVIIENDANAAAIGERWKGAGRGITNLICLTLGTGIGGGIIVDGKLVHGADGMAAELGHITVQPNGPQCNCGNYGCLEALASATAIRREAIEASIMHPESDLNERCNGNRQTITAEMVYFSAQSGDPVSRKIYQVMGRYLGIGIATLINIFNPEMVVIGGGVSGAWEMFIPYTKEEVNKRSFKIPAEKAKIVPAVCGDDAGLLGGAYLVFNLEA